MPRLLAQSALLHCEFGIWRPDQGFDHDSIVGDVGHNLGNTRFKLKIGIELNDTGLVNGNILSEGCPRQQAGKDIQCAKTVWQIFNQLIAGFNCLGVLSILGIQLGKLCKNIGTGRRV